MLQSVLLAAICACLLFAGNSEACDFSDGDLSWSISRPKDLKLPPNGKIFSRLGIRLTNEKGEELEMLIQNVTQSGSLKAYASKRGFVTGERITIHPRDRSIEPFTVTISSIVDEEAPPAPVLTIGESSDEIKIAGDGLFYIIEDETGAIDVTETAYFSYGAPKTFRAVAVDEAANLSLASNWITTSGECPKYRTMVHPPFGCSSATGGSALSLLLLLAFRRARFSR